MEIGFTTGRFDKNSLSEKISFFSNLGCTAIELSWLDYARAEQFKNFLDGINLENFSYRSMHGPVKIAGVPFFYQQDKTTFEILKSIEDFVKKYQVQAVVIHPDRVKDWSVFGNYKIPIGIENMDSKKSEGRTMGDLENYFNQIDAGLVMDVNHLYTNDKTLKLFDELYSKFQNKTKHFHLSGFVEYHEPLFQTKQTEIIDLVKNKNISIIIESVCETLEDYETEYKYVIDCLNR